MNVTDQKKANKILNPKIKNKLGKWPMKGYCLIATIGFSLISLPTPATSAEQISPYLDLRHYQTLRFHSGNSGSDQIFKEATAIADNIQKVETDLETKSTNKWPLVSYSKPLCLDLKSEWMRLAELRLLHSAQSETQWLTSRTKALATLQEMGHFIADYRLEMQKELGGGELQSALINVAGFDQGSKTFRWAEIPSKYSLSPAEQDYFDTQLKLQNCENVQIAEPILWTQLRTEGWPKRSVYGEKVDYYFFVVAQHMQQNRELMLLAQSELKRAVTLNETNTKFYPDITDKILVLQGDPQEFGTWHTCIDGQRQPVNGLADSTNVDKRRKAYGFKRSLQEQLMLSATPDCPAIQL